MIYVCIWVLIGLASYGVPFVGFSYVSRFYGGSEVTLFLFYVNYRNTVCGRINLDSVVSDIRMYDSCNLRSIHLQHYIGLRLVVRRDVFCWQIIWRVIGMLCFEIGSVSFFSSDSATQTFLILFTILGDVLTSLLMRSILYEWPSFSRWWCSNRASEIQRS